jgi:hypothetical protein
MTGTVELGAVSAHVAAQIETRVAEHRVVVWYDGERAFGGLLPRLEDRLRAQGYAVITADASPLRARREADAVYRGLGEPDRAAGLLVYVPRARGRQDVDQHGDPFEG